MSNLKGLEITDPRRQAIPPLRGYDYQVWQSVLRWITLGEGEALFLEGAEDFDVLLAGEAETVQVKETAHSGHVTLNSKNVIEAIAHFWAHQKNNPDYVIRFRFLTTSERGLEQGSPFGGVRGVDYWDQGKRPNTDLQPLRSFLSSKAALPIDLRDFIVNAPDDELRDRLIRRIDWDTGQGDQAQIEEVVRKRAITHGAHLYLLPPSEALKIVPHLFRHVWEVICREENRRLEYADFARLFEEHSTIRVTRNELYLRAASAGMMAGLGPGAMVGAGIAGSGLISESGYEAYALPPIHQLVRREHLVSELRGGLVVRGILVLRGSSGMGKSTLAALIASEEGGRWRKLDMRDLAPEQIKEHLIYATLADAEEPDHTDYIIDDLNFDERPSLYERALAGFIHAVLTRGRRIIVTTQGELPSRILLALSLPQEINFKVPILSEEEVGQVALNHGCPPGLNLHTWQRIIHTNAVGHPLLVHARVRNIAAKGWPKPKVEDLFAPEGIEDVLQEVRRRLQEQLPSEHARTLAYRLSILSAYFKRAHALHLAQHPPAIPNPGEAFDLLVGPWVEPLQAGYHRLSPLLKNSAEQILGPEQVKYLHKTAAYAFLTDKVLTPTELGGVLFHGLVGEIDEPLLAIVPAALGIKGEDWAAVSREIDWFARIATEPGQKLFASSALTSLMLRPLQFKVAAELDNADLALRVAASWEHELSAFDEYRGDKGFPAAKLSAQYTFNMALFRLEVPLSIKTVVTAISNIVITVRECKQAAASGDEITRQALEIGPDNLGDIKDYLFVAAARCKSADDVAEFLATLEEQDFEAAEAIWAGFRDNDYTAMLLMNAAWLGETKAEVPDWLRSLEVIDRAIEKAAARKVDALVAQGFRAKAILLKEYIPGCGDAVGVLTDGINTLGYEHPILQDYLAKVYMLDGRYRDALDLWKTIPPEDESQGTSTHIFSYREAVICAGNINDWGAAAKYALRGRESATRLTHLGSSIAVGFLTDYAFAFWKLGDPQKALEAFARVVDVLGSLPSPADNLSSYILHMKVVYVIKWIGQNLPEPENLFEPQPGWFSDPHCEVPRDKPVAPYAFYWYFLADAEYKSGVDAGIFIRFLEEARLSNSGLIKTQVEELRLRYSLRNLSLESLINQYALYAKTVRTASVSGAEEMPPSFDYQMIFVLTFAALVKEVGAGQLGRTPLEQWRSDAKSQGLFDARLERLFDFIEYVLDADAHQLLPVLTDSTQPGEFRLVAALVLSASDCLSPEELFNATVLLITMDGAYVMWRQETEPVVERLVADKWAAAAEEERFALISPAANGPEILRACRDGSADGLKKAARILLAADKAVRTTLPESILIRLRELAGSQSE